MGFFSIVLMEVTDNFVGQQRRAAAYCCYVPSQLLSSGLTYLEVFSRHNLSGDAKARESTLLCCLCMISFNGRGI